MSLFPAYGQAQTGQQIHDECMQSDSEDSQQGVELSPSAECALLAEPPPPPAPRAPAPPLSSDFYLDRKLDRGNLRVSTLYYPARPEYRARDAAALGASARAVRAARGEGARGEGARAPRVKRYWRRGGVAAAGGTDAGAAGELAQRGAAFRQALEATPHDEDLWQRYIDFLEWSGSEGGDDSKGEGLGGALEAARGAAALNPRSGALRSRLHAALRRALAPLELARALRDMRTLERCPEARAELFARVMSALACAGQLAGARDAAAAAAADRSLAQHYHLIIIVFGCVLRSGGLWEQLVQLVELLVAMNFPQSEGFPPPPSPARDAAAEEQLAAWEGRALASGLPVSAVWARVERARAALHWRAPAALDALSLAADPQRAPPPAALADLLAPAPDERAAFRLLTTLLRLAETPLLPASGYVHRAAAGSAGAAEVAADWEAGAGLSLLALVRAARRLPPAHPARAPLSPRAARSLLAYTPLRSATVSFADDDTGFGSWVRALWEAALCATSGARRAALLCWRLRVLHASALIAVTHEERRAVRGEARECLRRWAGGSALPFVVFARVEAACDVASDSATGEAGKMARGVRAAVQAARQALLVASGDHATPAEIHTALYAARVVVELCGAGSPLGQWAAAAAATRRSLPLDADASSAPPAQLLEAARQECERQCLSLEAQYAAAEEQLEHDEEERGTELAAAMLPGAAEWASLRAALVAPARRRRLLDDLRATSCWRRSQGARYREQAACALVAAATHDCRAAAARALAPRFPLSTYLALVSSGTPAWQRAAGGAGDRALSLSHPRGECGAWAAVLPALLRAASAGWAPQESHVVYRLCSRALREGSAGAAGGALLQALRCETAPDPRAPLTHALALVAHCKWVLVRGAALGGAAAALAELALERGLRLHALPDELAPLHCGEKPPGESDKQV